MAEISDTDITELKDQIEHVVGLTDIDLRGGALKMAVESMKNGTLSNNVDENTTGAILARAEEFAQFIKGLDR